MKVKSIKDKQKWENFLAQCKQKTFLDAWNWGKFQEKRNKKIWRLGIIDRELRAVAQVIKINAKRGTFLFVPHGPVTDDSERLENKVRFLKILKEKLRDIAEKEDASFLRVGPIWKRSSDNQKVFDDLGFRQAPLFIHPELTLELDLNQPERGLLKNMRKSTRRSIRKAEQQGVETFKSKKVEDLDKFYELYQKVVDRNDFVPFSRDYVKKQFSTFLEDDQILTIFSRYKGEVLSSAIIVFWQDKAFYHHGASDLSYDVPISHPVQWEAIKEAKSRGCDVYNFWGVAPEDASEDHPWAGLTTFKTGFGGERKEYVKTQDLPLSLAYWPTFFFEKLRRKKRNI